MTTPTKMTHPQVFKHVPNKVELIARMTPEVYEKLESKMLRTAVTSETTAHQAGYQLGVAAVLHELRKGYVIGVASV